KSRRTSTVASTTSSTSPVSGSPAMLSPLTAPGSGNRLGDLRPQPRELLQVLAALAPEALDQGAVLVDAFLSLIEPHRLQDLDVVDAGQRGGHLVSEVGVALPGDGALGDGFHHRARVGDGHLLAALVVGRAADAAGVEQEHLEAAAVQQLEEPVALLLVQQREEGIG